jgi:hypothetical protein
VEVHHASLQAGHPPPDGVRHGLVTAMTVAGCADSGPVAPNRELIDAVGSATLAKSSGVTDNLWIPVSFTIAGGTCGLTATVTGNGVFHIVARSTQTGTGAWHVSFSWNAHGTATGSDGSSYRFNYAITAKSVAPTGPGDLATIDVVDHFNLLGQGKTPDLKVYIRGTFLFPAFTPIGNPVVRGPGIFCDPI